MDTTGAHGGMPSDIPFFLVFAVQTIAGYVSGVVLKKWPRFPNQLIVAVLVVLAAGIGLLIPGVGWKAAAGALASILIHEGKQLFTPKPGA